MEYVQDNSAIQHKVIRAVLEYLNITQGIELSHMADIPASCGMGSSSAFIVGLLHSLNTLLGHNCTPKQLWQNAIIIEQQILNEAVGYQDSVFAAVGGFSYIKFSKEPTNIEVFPVPISHDNLEILENNLLLYFTGKKREGTGNDVAKQYVNDLNNKKSYLLSIYDIARASLKVLSDGNLDEIGTLLDLSWMAKRSISDKISSTYVDELYSYALKNHAKGGKLVGAGGGGGNILFYVPKEKQSQFREAMKDLVEIPFCFEKDGSSIILNTNRK